MATAVISTKGQLVIPQNIRTERGWGPGTRVSIRNTPYGLMIFEIPEKPLKYLKGLTKHLGISSKSVKELRRNDEEHDRKEETGI